MVSWFDTVNRFADPLGAARMGQFLALLDRFPTGHVVDLGAGHGNFSRLAAARGWRVTAVDARDARFGAETNIRWVVSDVREFDQYDDVDLVVNLGLWYHLSADDQAALARAMHPRPVILDTHVAMPVQSSAVHEAKMSGVVTVDGLRGRYYDESGFERRPTASWGNVRSFWPDLPSLQQQFFAAGYDFLDVVAPSYTPDRGFFVARSLGDDAAKEALDDAVTTLMPMPDPDAAPRRTMRHTLVRPLPAAVGAREVPGVKQASAELGTALAAMGRFHARRARRTLAARKGRS